MTIRIVAAGALAFLFASAGGSAQTPPRPLLHGFSSVAISPDGTRVLDLENPGAAPEATAPPQAHIVLRTRGADGEATIECPTTPCTIASPVWSPDGSRIAYLVRDTKAKTAGVWLSSADGKSVKPWLQHFNGLLNNPRWSPDGTSLALLATADPHKEIGATQAGAAMTGEVSATLAQDVQRLAILSAAGTLTFASPSDLFIYEYDWMPNGRGFAATGAHGNGDNDWWIAKLYTIDAANATARERYTPPKQIHTPRVSPDGRTIAFIAGLHSDFGPVGGDIYVIPTRDGAPRNITPGIAASPNGIDWRGNTRIAFTALAGDSAAYETVDVATAAITPIWSAPESLSASGNLRISFARDGRTSAVVRQTFETPPEIWSGPVGAWTALTHANAALAPVVHARSIAWTSDGFHVQGWLLTPRTVAADKTYPMVTIVHGGPSAASGPSFIARGSERDLIERGYFVFMPNPRGSFGQGEAFTAANIRDIGGGDLRDILAGIDAVEKVAPVDEHRLGIMGHSYGGYMSMWSVTQTQRFRAAVAGAGIADWQSYYGQNGIDEWMIPFFGASVYDDPAIYAKSSPITYIKNAKTPTFIYVGERDVECPAPQSLEYWHALETLGVPASLVIYEGEGHAIRSPAHNRDLTARTLAWFDKYLN